MGEALLGHKAGSDNPVWIQEEARSRGLYIIGLNGTGKTTLIENLAVQDMDAGRGLCVLDPHSDLVNRLLRQVPSRRKGDVVLLDPRDADWPFGLNPYACSDPTDPEIVGRVAAQIVELFKKLWGEDGSQGTSWGPRVAQYIRNTAFTLIENPGLTMAEIPHLLTDKSFRARVVPNIRNQQVRRFWRVYERLSEHQQDDKSESTLNKLDEFLTQPIVANIVGQSRTTVNFREFMDQGKIVLGPLGLGRLGDEVVNLLGSLIVLQILNSALGRENLEPDDRRQFSLYADEFHRFATPAFATFLAEARKYGVATTIAHQERSQLDARNRAAALNARNLAVFTVHGEDAEELAKQFDNTPPEAPIVGQRPVMAADPHASSHLSTHSSGRVRRISRDIIELMQDYLSLDYDRPISPPNQDWGHFHDRGYYRYFHGEVRAGLERVDDYLLDMMRNRALKSSRKQADLIWPIILRWRACFSIAPYRFDKYSDSEWQLPTESREALWELTLAAITRGDVTAKLDAYIAVRNSYWKAYAYQPMGATGNERHTTPEIKHRLSTERSEAEGAYALNLIRSLRLLGEEVAAKPLLFNTGEWEPIRGLPRSHADVEAEIANDLVTLKNYSARCKIVGTEGPLEFTMVPVKPKPDLPSGDIDWIRENSRQLYARPRADVETEMELRLTGEWQDPQVVRFTELQAYQEKGKRQSVDGHQPESQHPARLQAVRIDDIPPPLHPE